MKVGDVVTFVDGGMYAKWFFGKIAVVENVSINSKGEKHCRVKWIVPVRYHDRWTDFSDFKADNFEVYDGNE